MRGYGYNRATGGTDSMYIRNAAEWKRESVANVLDDSLPYYRYVIRDDSACGSGRIVWDTDTVLGITPGERGERPAENVPTDTPWPSEIPFGMPCPSDVDDITAYHSDATDERLRAEAAAAVLAVHIAREAEAACKLAGFARDAAEALSGLDATDDAAAYHSLAYVAAMLKREAVTLGWPIDGNGFLLPECKDEA